MKKYLKFNTPAHDEAKILASDYSLKNNGLEHLDRVYWNLTESALYPYLTVITGHVAFVTTLNALLQIQNS